MTEVRYPREAPVEADGMTDDQMNDSVDELQEAIVGRKIVRAAKQTVDGQYYGRTEGLVLTLDDGRKVELLDTDDCCAYTELEEFLLHPEMVEHAITGVGTTDDYNTWHIYADLGDIMTLKVGWSSGNPFYYGYGFSIRVKDIEA